MQYLRRRIFRTPTARALFLRRMKTQRPKKTYRSRISTTETKLMGTQAARVHWNLSKRCRTKKATKRARVKSVAVIPRDRATTSQTTRVWGPKTYPACKKPDLRSRASTPPTLMDPLLVPCLEHLRPTTFETKRTQHKVKSSMTAPSTKQKSTLNLLGRESKTLIKCISPARSPL